ncbi:DNA topoisomerase I, mitochondrial-like [Paramacrobiotus metropolitanus]|uniref:DNA topoisomerase I, mitochondrial-like n=1 Tax=Paramacrobiotus metropolitanus TaxID=2943436 RepID=UPI00244600A3|nr:DNA topoisomerase I, mitochondrial-like [Paramacrobiotus metropolitanus]XP_055355459.1 DNA topoisomerase I, mitochondrial-like [Paramacrobiotus metropolitanus]
MSPTAKVKTEVKKEIHSADGSIPNGTTDSRPAEHQSPAAVKRELGEAAEALLMLQNDGGSSSKKRQAQNGDHALKKVKSEPEASTSKDRTNGSSAKKKKKNYSDDEGDSDYEVAPKKKKTQSKDSSTKEKSKDKSKDKAKSSSKNDKKPVKSSPGSSTAGSPRKKKQEEEPEVWKWWEEKRGDDEIKWKTLQHKGPVFAPPYEPVPSHVKFLYDGKVMQLSNEAEEVATFYAKMLDHDYTTKEVFNKNFFKDWRKVMTAEEKKKIEDLRKCDFTQMATYFKEQTELRKQRTKEEKQKLKEENQAQLEEYGFCLMDGHKEKIGNFKIEPPGLFRGRGEHPKMGMLKRRVRPQDVIINCSSDATAPKPPPGTKWKEVRHDNRVTWLACWNENILGTNKYIMLNPSSKLKGEKDWKKYETARKLKSKVDDIRATYRSDWKSKQMQARQRAVALYFIDKLALRAGNEKEEGETADTVGCCSLRVEHIKLHDEIDGKKYMVDFDFLGKDSIRYQNRVEVEKRVFKNLKLFMANKDPGDDIFDRLNTTTLNKHLSELMEGLTAKVFRTYNASITLQEQLEKLTKDKDLLAGKMLSYNRANRAVAVLCNHQRSVPKTFSKQMENVQAKISAAKDKVKEAKKGHKEAKDDYKKSKSATNKSKMDKAEQKYERAKEALHKLEIAATDKEENKTIALGTSKLNYLDPRITVAWCKSNDVPIEKVYNKTQRDKFRWAIDMAGPDFVF